MLQKPKPKQKSDQTEAVKELRKIEKQAKILILKMKRLEKEWAAVRGRVQHSKTYLPKTLGDVLHGWSRMHHE